MKIFDNGVYREMTDQEILEIEEMSVLTEEQRINQLKKNLADTDYKAIKYAEGFISEEEYAPIKAQRQEWREEINKLEG